MAVGSISGLIFLSVSAVVDLLEQRRKQYKLMGELLEYLHCSVHFAEERMN